MEGKARPRLDGQGEADDLPAGGHGPGPAAGPIVQVSPMGGLGNRMIQYLAAMALAERVPGARLAQIDLPEWAIQLAPVPGAEARTEVATTDRLDLDGLAARLRDGVVDRVDIRSYAQQLANLPARAACQALFPAAAAPGAGPHELLISIRGGDVLDGHHPDYVQVPIEFYAELTQQTGLAPVFMGQLDDSPYMQALLAAFPDARTVPSGGALADFAFIRASHNIVPSVSTFSWLAAWLSDAARVFMPVLGLLHPLQSRGTNLLPLDDPRFRFFLFPFHYAVPVAQCLAAHASLRGLWRGMAPARLRALLAAPVPPRDRATCLQAFDEVSYLALYPDIAAAVSCGQMPSGRHHYEHHGFAEGREPFHIDRAWYCQTYPIAALELGQGDAPDVMTHFLSIGRDRGYQPHADERRQSGDEGRP